MAERQEEQTGSTAVPEPRGFGEHTRGLAGEYAHEQGWGLSQEQRQKIAGGPDGGGDYDYGAQDFGDEAVDTSSAKPTPSDVDSLLKE